MPTSRTRSPQPTGVHILVVGGCSDDTDVVELRITGSAAYRAGLAPADPVLQRAARFVAEHTTLSTVYISTGDNEPPTWIRVDNVAAAPDSDGEPILRFRQLAGGKLPESFRDSARRTQHVLLAATGTAPTNGWTAVLFIPTA